MRSLWCTVRSVTSAAAAATVLAVMIGGCAAPEESGADDAAAPTTAVDPSAALDAPGGHDASVSVTYAIVGDGSGTNPAVDELANLEQRLTDALESKGIGEVGRDRFANGTVTVTVSGPSLDALWKQSRPIFESYAPRPATAELRVGGPDGDVTKVTL